MISHTTKRFRNAYDELPAEIKEKTKKSFDLWNQDQDHPSLKFKQIHPNEPIYSVRVGLRWRALGVRQGDVMIWFWIGSHADYDKLITQMR